MVEKKGHVRQNPADTQSLTIESPLESQRISGGAAAYRVSQHPSFAEVRFSITPSEGIGLAPQLRSCLKKLDDALSSIGLPKEAVCQQSTYSRGDAKEIGGIIDESFRGNPPASMHVGEPPLQGPQIATEHMVLIPRGKNIRIRCEPVSLDGGDPFQNIVIESSRAKITRTAVEHPKYGLARYTVVEDKTTGGKRIYAAGLTGGAEDIKDSAVGAFELQKKILDAEGMQLRHIMCERNFIQDIDGENYHVFNGVRRKYWANAFTPGHLHEDWPAATGIGQDVNGVVIKFTAEKSNRKRICIDNPGQTRSDSYAKEFQAEQAVTAATGQKIGEPVKQSGAGQTVNRPAFSRALALISEDASQTPGGEAVGEVFISGTASISGKKGGGKHIPFAPGGFQAQYVDVSEIISITGRERMAESGLKMHDSEDKVYMQSAVEAQTIDTINNISRLIGAKNLKNHGVDGYTTLDDIKRLRVYVKHPEEAGKVMGVCRKIFGECPTLCVKADVCYADLLVELGGVAQLKKPEQ